MSGVAEKTPPAFGWVATSCASCEAPALLVYVPLMPDGSAGAKSFMGVCRACYERASTRAWAESEGRKALGP